MGYKEKVMALLNDNELSQEQKEKLEAIFPELKETEDEKAKKEILEYCKQGSRGVRIMPVTPKDFDIWVAWLEKQGEQKLIIDGILTATNYDKMFQNCNVHEFNAGDWVIFNGLVLHIDEIVDGYYRTTTIGGIPNSYDWNIDNAARLWTIQDAKDGDVLYSLDSKQPFIYKERPQFSQAIGYCCINKFDEFAIWNTSKCVICTNKYIPATKEQRDTLFAKIKESGYEWDAEKKELKLLITNGGDFDPAWSEEDEEKLNQLHKLIVKKAYEEYGIDTEDETLYGKWLKLDNWLKSLKNCVQPQWKPSEEQMKSLSLATQCIYAEEDIKKLIHFMNNLKL